MSVSTFGSPSFAVQGSVTLLIFSTAEICFTPEHVDFPLDGVPITSGRERSPFKGPCEETPLHKKLDFRPPIKYRNQYVLQYPSAPFFDTPIACFGGVWRHFFSLVGLF